MPVATPTELIRLVGKNPFILQCLQLNITKTPKISSYFEKRSKQLPSNHREIEKYVSHYSA